MSAIRKLSSLRSSATPPERRSIAPWRLWTALLTAITFAVLVSTAAMHHHATTVEDQDCAICSVVTHKLAELPLITIPQPIVVLVSYAPFLVLKPRLAHPSPLLLPPSCGPPRFSMTLC